MCLRVLWIDMDDLLPSENGFIPELRLCCLDCEAIVSLSLRNISRDDSTSGENQAEENRDRCQVPISSHVYHLKICDLGLQSPLYILHRIYLLRQVKNLNHGLPRIMAC